MNKVLIRLLAFLSGATAAILIFLLALMPFIGGLAVLISLFIGDRTPGSIDFPAMVGCYTIWMGSVGYYAVVQTLLITLWQAACVHLRHVGWGMLAVALLMVMRLHGSLVYFPEIWMAIAGMAVLMVIGLFVSPPVEQQAVVARPGAHAQPLPVADTPLRNQAATPRYTFADVIGMTDLKKRLRQVGEEVLASRRSAGPRRNGILFSGKPGNGKTFIAEALAGELQLPFLSVSFGNVASIWINSTTENVVQIFRDARRQAPCVLFIDEVDSLIAERNHLSGNDEAARTTNTILTELVDIRSAGVVVMAATNYLERLDVAAIREGRFDFKIEIPTPDREARRHLLRSNAQRALSDETVASAVTRWEGFSVARITAIMAEANARADGAVLHFADLQAALRTIQGRKGHIPEDTPTLECLTMDDTLKTQLQGLVGRMVRIQEIEALGGSVPRGVLFFGPPGSGKTLAARSLAKTAHWAFLTVSGMDLLADPSKVDALVDEASELRPCVVLIDEADDVLRDRRVSTTVPVTNKLLAALDGANGKIPDVMFIAATNHPETMDAAALRGGRFTEKIEFTPPSLATLWAVLTQWQATSKARLAAQFSMAQAAESLLGFSIADVREILQATVNLAIGRLSAEESIVTIDMRDIAAAIQLVSGQGS